MENRDAAFLEIAARLFAENAAELMEAGPPLDQLSSRAGHEAGFRHVGFRAQQKCKFTKLGSAGGLFCVMKQGARQKGASMLGHRGWGFAVCGDDARELLTSRRHIGVETWSLSTRALITLLPVHQYIHHPSTWPSPKRRHNRNLGKTVLPLCSKLLV